MDIYQNLPAASKKSLQNLREEREKWLAQDKKGFRRYRDLLAPVSHLRAQSVDFSGDVVTIGRQDELSPEEHKSLLLLLQGLMPWRKGPFNIFGIDIDAEWRSERKWNRVLPELPDLTDKVIADIGCSNGYYMFRMASQNPRMVLGFEPYIHPYYTFQALNTFADCKNLRLELLGVEHISLFEDYFDVVFLMGVLYHRSSPIEALKDIRIAMRPGATLIVESQGIPGNDPVALFPDKTYAKVPGTYFVPTAECLKNWLQKAGFADVNIFCSHPMSNREQRRTEWMAFESYDDFIDPQNPARTVEGYPAPLRIFAKGVRI